MRHFLATLALGLSLTGLAACSQPQATSEAIASASPAEAPTAAPAETPTSAPGTDLTPLFSHIWRVESTSPPAAPGSIFVFLANGTLLQTSCVETYAISGWTIDKATPQVLTVSENGQPAFTAEILELSNATLRLRLQLLLSNETKELNLSAVEEEFVCPDLPR